MNKREKFTQIIEYFKIHMPSPETELHYQSPFQLIVAVILSAQCTDKRVNLITPELFKIYPTAETMSKASVEDIYKIIKSCSYPNNKAKNIKGMAVELYTKYHSTLPEDTELMQTLPGIGRKTAHVLASVLFNKPTLAVDTHVFRVSARIGLTKNAKNPLDCEKQLMKYIPLAQVHNMHHWLILHGRYVCEARKPKCTTCGIREYCDYDKK